MRNYAQVLLAGGLAAVYFTTYAAHHFANLQIIPSATVDGVLLLAWAGFIIWVADRKKSEVLAIFALLLAYYTSVITHAGLFTLYSNLVLTLAAVFFLVRNRWATVSFAGLAATYISYAFWRFFHAGLWRWAEPTEGLWTGNCFLIGYWLLFTAAVFLSRHEQFNGGRRASFLSINNGAFFSAFLLSMLQVHQGGFWKFSLIFGTVLVGLAALAWRVLTGDKLARNAYLTQGLLLVTLGFLTHLAGLKLSLVLGVESVILLMIGQQLKSRVMQAGSLITSALAVGYAVVTIEPFDHNGLITGSAVGALMLWNAFSIRGKITFDQSSTQPRILFYTVLALAMWLATTWQNASGDWRGLAVAGESIAILLAARPLSNRVLVFGAYVFAGIALSWETIILGRQFVSVEISERVGLLQGILLGVALLFNSLWEQRLSPPANRQQFHPPVTFFSALGLLAWLLTTGVFTPHEYLAPLLAIEALALTAAFVRSIISGPRPGALALRFRIRPARFSLVESGDHYCRHAVACRLVAASEILRYKTTRCPRVARPLRAGDCRPALRVAPATIRRAHLARARQSARRAAHHLCRRQPFLAACRRRANFSHRQRVGILRAIVGGKTRLGFVARAHRRALRAFLQRPPMV
jgi:hypothetical protein